MFLSPSAKHSCDYTRAMTEHTEHVAAVAENERLHAENAILSAENVTLNQKYKFAIRLYRDCSKSFNALTNDKAIRRDVRSSIRKIYSEGNRKLCAFLLEAEKKS